MSTALDLAALAAQGELKIPIARGVVSQGGTGTDYTGWDGVSSVFVEAKVEVREQSRGFATLTLTVEGSTNGSVWSTLETFTFGAGGTQSATISSPDDHLRVSWAVGGHSEWQIIEVTAAPSIIDTGAGGGAEAPLVLTGTDPDTVPLTILAASGQAEDLVRIRDGDGFLVLTLDPGGGLVLQARDDDEDPIFRVRSSSGGSAITVAGDGSGNVGDITINNAAGGGQLDLDSLFVTLGDGNASAVIRFDSPAIIWNGINAAPADFNLNASSFALWLDDSPGATKLMIKAKDSGGTVKTGSVNLT